MDLLYLANEKVKVDEGEAVSIAVRKMAEYKEFDDFMNNTIEARVDAYIVGFTDYKKKVAQTFFALYSSEILAPREDEEEEGEAAK